VTLGDLNRLAHAVELVLVAQDHEPRGELVAADVHLLPVCLLAVHRREEALDLLVLVPGHTGPQQAGAPCPASPAR
jgi:hypothetical protein